MLAASCRCLETGALLPGLLRLQQVYTPHLRKAANQRAFATEEDTHSDFKPKYKGGPVSDVEQTITQDVTTNDVFIYMKGVPEEPMCGFSNMACRILDAYGVKYGSRNVLADAGVREGVKKFTSWPTIPQVFVKGEFIGGSDILMSMHQSGELPKVLGLEEAPATDGKAA